MQRLSTTVGIGDFTGGTVSLTQTQPGGVLDVNNGLTIARNSDSSTATTGRVTETLTQIFLGIPSTSTNVIYTIVPNSKYLLMTQTPGHNQLNVIAVEK